MFTLKRHHVLALKLKANMYFVVVHMKNPKDQAEQVSADLKTPTELLKEQSEVPL